MLRSGKVTLTFDLANEDERYEYEAAVAGSALACAVQEWFADMRSMIKHADMPKAEVLAMDNARTLLRDNIRERVPGWGE